MTRLFEPGTLAYERVPPALLRAAVRNLAKNRASTAYDLAVALGAPLVDVEPIWRAMCADGYISPHPRWGYAPTEKINDLLHLRVGRGLPRVKADALLQQLIANARSINALPESHYVYRVARLAVFGSYLDLTRELLGDLDIAWTPENRSEQVFLMRGVTHASLDSYGGTRTLLRPKGPYVKLQDMQEMLRLKCPYRIFFDAAGPIP